MFCYGTYAIRERDMDIYLKGKKIKAIKEESCICMNASLNEQWTPRFIVNYFTTNLSCLRTLQALFYVLKCPL